MPLAYRTGDRFSALLTLYGSALPYAGVPALFSAALTLTLNLAVPRDYLLDIFRHPYPFQPFAYIAAFVLVFRTNVAYNRYWECASSMTQAAAKWGDAVVEALTFDELPIGPATGEEGTSTASMQALTQRRAFQALLIRRFSLMHALALQYLRRDAAVLHLATCLVADCDDTPSSDASLNSSRSRRWDALWKELPVLGGVSETERMRLEASRDRVGFVFSQILAQMNTRRSTGGLGVDAPVLSRVYQLISDGMLGYRQARKLEDVPFPFAYTQMVTAFLAIFTATFPLVLACFAVDDMGTSQWTAWAGPLLAFITVTAYAGLHKVARALEDPFVHPPNDLPAVALQRAFNERLLTSWDAMRCDADHHVGVAEEGVAEHKPLAWERYEGPAHAAAAAAELNRRMVVEWRARGYGLEGLVPSRVGAGVGDRTNGAHARRKGGSLRQESDHPNIELLAASGKC